MYEVRDCNGVVVWIGTDKKKGKQVRKEWEGKVYDRERAEIVPQKNAKAKLRRMHD